MSTQVFFTPKVVPLTNFKKNLGDLKIAHRTPLSHWIMMEGEIEFVLNSTINRLCHKKMKVSCFQDISIVSNSNSPVLSDVDGSGPREKAYILVF